MNLHLEMFQFLKTVNSLDEIFEVVSVYPDGDTKVCIFGSVKEPKESVCLCVRLCVCPAQTCLKVSIFILEQSGSVSGQSKVSLRSV